MTEAYAVVVYCLTEKQALDIGGPRSVESLTTMDILGIVNQPEVALCPFTDYEANHRLTSVLVQIPLEPAASFDKRAVGAAMSLFERAIL